jgi:chorismate mutase
METKRLFGLRGAVFCANDPRDIETRVAQLYDALVGDNGLEEDDIVSLIFSVTPDLTAVNPAAALRKGGRGQGLALFSVQESMAEGGRSGVIRVLLHCYAPLDAVLKHAYLNGAEVLRPDRAGPFDNKIQK